MVRKDSPTDGRSGKGIATYTLTTKEKEMMRRQMLDLNTSSGFFFFTDASFHEIYILREEIRRVEIWQNL